MEESVTLKLSTYDNLQMELVNLQDEVKTLIKTINSTRVFELKESYNSKKNLCFTEYALEEFRDLVDANPTLEFSKLDEMVAWGIAKPKEETEGDSDA